MIKRIFLSGYLLFFAYMLYSQGVAINSDGSMPDASAMLDINSSNSGILIPRMTSVQRISVSSPANSLLVYDTTTGSFWYYDLANTKWVEIMDQTNIILADEDGDTYVTIEESPDDDIARIYIAGKEKLRITERTLEQLSTGQSVFIGEGAGENDDLNSRNNTGVGANSLNSNTTGCRNTSVGCGAMSYAQSLNDDNVAVGYYSMGSGTAYTSSDCNSSVGAYSLFSIKGGDYNTAMGYYSLYSNTSGYRNVAYGYNSMKNNTTGYQNLAIGDYALYSNSTSVANIAIGSHSLYYSDAANNMAVGNYALFSNTSGYHNVACGGGALRSNTTGDYNNALGCNAFYSGTAYNYSTAIGYNALISASRQVRIGSTSSTYGPTSIGGRVGWTTVSDKRFKSDITENVPGLEFILKLHPVTYHFSEEAIKEFMNMPDSLLPAANSVDQNNVLQTGFIAQEVEQAANECHYDFSGVDKPKNENDYYGLRYAEFVVPLVKAVQEQQEIINKQQKTIDMLIERIEAIEKSE